MSGAHSGIVRSRSVAQWGNVGCILFSRGDGWDLRDSEGWSRYRYCRPIIVRGLKIPGRGNDFVGWPGDLEEVRHILALTSDGRRSHVQESWQIH